jgi:exopolyphosphatase / guanosine-5'-triphosphate,3'-diphosphate pyrophosphatase
MQAHRVDGYRLSLDACERIHVELAAKPVARRRDAVGLHPDRAPTIVAGGVILAETMRLFAFGEIEVSEHDILEGAALEIARKHA